MSERA